MTTKKNLSDLKSLGIYSFNDEKLSKEIDVKVISTGSKLLNDVLEIGGWPEGKLIEIFGVDSSGKTTLALQTVAEAQKAGKSVVYMDLENTLNSKWAKKLGVNLSELFISRPKNGESAFEILNNLVDRKDIGLIIVDSVAALVPSYEFEGDIRDQTMGLHARLMSKGLRLLQSKMIDCSTTIIFINQIRDKIGANSFIPVTTTTGGRALKYSSCIRVEIRRVESIKDSNGEVLGFVTKCMVVKNKFGSPMGCATTAIYFDSGFDIDYEIIQLALDKKVIVKKGSWFEYKEKNLAQGVQQLRMKIKQNPDLKEELMKLVF